MSDEKQNLLFPEVAGMVQSGQKVEMGVYCCCNCGKNSKKISKDGNKLPICKVCNDFTYWFKA